MIRARPAKVRPAHGSYPLTQRHVHSERNRDDRIRSYGEEPSCCQHAIGERLRPNSFRRRRIEGAVATVPKRVSDAHSDDSGVRSGSGGGAGRHHRRATAGHAAKGNISDGAQNHIWRAPHAVCLRDPSRPAWRRIVTSFCFPSGAPAVALRHLPAIRRGPHQGVVRPAARLPSNHTTGDTKTVTSARPNNRIRHHSHVAEQRP